MTRVLALICFGVSLAIFSCQTLEPRPDQRAEKTESATGQSIPHIPDIGPPYLPLEAHSLNLSIVNGGAIFVHCSEGIVSSRAA